MEGYVSALKFQLIEWAEVLPPLGQTAVHTSTIAGGETMLKSKRRWLLALLMLAPLGQSPEAHAQVAGTVQIIIPGCVTLTNPTMPVTQVCPTFTLSQATVTAISDGVGVSNDTLKFTGTITASQDISQAEIKITRVFNYGPNMPAWPKIYYKTCATGTLTQDTGMTNSFTLTGSVANPVGQLPRQMGAQIYYSSTQNVPFTCTVGSALTTGLWPTSPALTGDRLLQADLFVSLKAGGIMNLSGSNSIKIQTAPSADHFPTPPGTGSPGQSSCGGLFTQCTTHSTSRLFSSSSEDVVMSDDAEAKAFAGSCWQNLTNDIARSGGEYLSSLASLLKVQPEDQRAFVALAQAHYAIHQEQGTLVPETFVEGLRDEILATSHPTKVATYVGH